MKYWSLVLNLNDSDGTALMNVPFRYEFPSQLESDPSIADCAEALQAILNQLRNGLPL